MRECESERERMEEWQKNVALGVAEDIVEIIRVRHTLQVHGQRFTSYLSLTVKFITSRSSNSKGPFGQNKEDPFHL